MPVDLLHRAWSRSGSGGAALAPSGVRPVWLAAACLVLLMGSAAAAMFNPPAGAAAAIYLVSGNNQSVSPGQMLPTLLSAAVVDADGNRVAGQAVNWSVMPSGAGSFNSPSLVSGSNGQVQTGFTLSANAAGIVLIAVSLADYPAISATFSEYALPAVTVTALQKVSGDNQTATPGQPFANPLVVRAIAASGQPVPNAPVQFTLIGPATLSNPAVVTDVSGQARVLVYASSATGPVTVSASANGLTVTFTLSVIPAGPVIAAGGFANAADRKVGALSPCSLATLTGTGLAPTLQGAVTGTAVGPAPFTLLDIGIAFPGNPAGDRAAPIFSVTNGGAQQTAIFQVPCGTPPGNVPVTVTVGGFTTTVTVPVQAASPGIFGTTGTDGVARAVLERPDGSFVSLTNPARRGETVTAVVTGLGPVLPAVGTNQLPPRGVIAAVTGTVVPGLSGSGAALVSARLTSNQVGVYRVSFAIPASINTGNNIGFSIAVIPAGSSTPVYSSLAYIPIQ